MLKLIDRCRAITITKLNKIIELNCVNQLPEIGTAREDKPMKVISGTHGINDDIGEGTRIEAFDLDMLAEGSEVAIDAAQLPRGAVGVLRRRNGCDFGFGMFPILRLLHAALHIKTTLSLSITALIDPTVLLARQFYFYHFKYNNNNNYNKNLFLFRLRFVNLSQFNSLCLGVCRFSATLAGDRTLFCGSL